MRRSSTLVLAAAFLVGLPGPLVPAAAAEEPAPPPVAPVAPAPAPAPPATPPAPAPPAGPTAGQAEEKLQSEADVKAAEEHLRRLGLPGGKVDGKQTQYTRRALCAFREVHPDLKGSRAHLTRADLDALAATTELPPPRSGGTAVTVSEKCQVIYVVKDGKYAHVGAASTGKIGGTPNGQHRIEWRWPGWHESNAVDNGHMYNATYFRAGGYAIHGSRLPILPSPTSHGCVRVKKATADLVIELPIGTPVTVRGTF